MESPSKTLSKPVKVVLGLIALVVVSHLLFGPNDSPTENKPAAAGPTVAEALPSTEPSEKFSFLSTESPDGTSTYFNVFLWRATSQSPCIAAVRAPVDSADLALLKASVEAGLQRRRAGIGAELLSRCSQRFVYLDGGSEGPGTWAEWIGKGAEKVVHSVSVRASSADALVLDLRPGTAPAKEAEFARLETMLAEVEKIIANGAEEPPALIAEMQRRRTQYQSELEKLRATGPDQR